MSFLTRLDAVIAELAAHPRVRVLGHWRGPPLGAAAEALLQAALDARPPPALIALYAAADGVQLRWRVDTPVPRCAPVTPPVRGPPSGRPKSVSALECADLDGCINLVPVEAMRQPAGLWLGRAPGDAPRGARALDAFSAFAFATWGPPRGSDRAEAEARPPGPEAPTGEAFAPIRGLEGATRTDRTVRVWYGYGAEAAEDAPMTAEDYLERLLTTRGAMVARTEGYARRRRIPLPRLPPRWRPDRDTLDRLVEAVAEGW